MTVNLKWNGQALVELIRRQLAAGLQAAGIELQRIAQQQASVPSAGTAGAVLRRGKGGSGPAGTSYLHPAAPGQSPRMRTGLGRQSIVSGFDPESMQYRVGYSGEAPYMLLHELGIRYKKAGKQQRPTIVPALQEHLPRLVFAARAAAGKVRP